MRSLRTNKQFYDVTIGVADVHLHHAITTRARLTNRFDPVGAHMSACLFQVIYLEGNMSAIAPRHLITAIVSWMHLSGTPRLSLTNDMHLSALFTKPCTGEIEVAWTGNLLHAKHLTIKMT